MAQPMVAQKGPFEAELVAGRTYWWCACGRSARQPFCDESHKDTGIAPLKHVATASGPAWLCGCKQSKGAPFCDGSHNAL